MFMIYGMVLGFANYIKSMVLIDILLKMMPRNVHIFNLMKIRYRKELRNLMIIVKRIQLISG